MSFSKRRWLTLGSKPTIRAPPPQNSFWTSPAQSWGCSDAGLVHNGKKGRVPKVGKPRRVATFRGATEPLRPDDPHPQNPLAPTRFGPPFWPDFDLNLTRFWPLGAIWGQNRVKFRSKSGHKGGPNRVGVSGIWGWGSSGRSGSVAPSKSCNRREWPPIGVGEKMAQELSVKSPALILSKFSDVFLAKVG